MCVEETALESMVRKEVTEAINASRYKAHGVFSIWANRFKREVLLVTKVMSWVRTAFKLGRSVAMGDSSDGASFGVPMWMEPV